MPMKQTTLRPSSRHADKIKAVYLKKMPQACDFTDIVR